MFYAYWVNLSYLPFFILLLSFLILIKFYQPRPSLLFLIAFCSYCYLFEIRDFLNFNKTIFLTDFSEILINLLLTNILNKIHPFLYYSGLLIFFFTTLGILWNCFFFQKFNYSTQFYTYKQVWLTGFFLTTTALFLGSWWALQEGTWGGWWNWDPSETLGLLTLLVYLLLFHKSKNLLNFEFYLLLLKLILIFFTIYFFFIHINFTSLSHNFGFSTIYPYNSKHTSLLLAIILLTYLLISSSLKRKIFKLVSKLNRDFYTFFFFTKNYLLFFRFLLIPCILVWPLYTSMILINFFLPKILTANTLNFFFYQNFSLFLIILILNFYIAECSVKLFFFILITFFTTIRWVYIFFIFKNYKILRKGHFFFLVLLFINFTTYNQDYVFWTCASNYFPYSAFLYPRSTPIYFISTTLIKKHFLFLENYDYVLLGSTLSQSSNSKELFNFILYVSQKNFLNFFIFSNTSVVTYFQFETHNILNLFFFTVIFCFFFYVLWNLKKPINFL